MTSEKPIKYKSYICSTDAAKMTGIANKKENFEDSTLPSPINKPMVMVIPDRDTPGIKARIWARPISNPI